MSSPAALRIHLEQTGGNESPLLLLHGVGRNGRDFAPLLPWLNTRRLYLWDHRGHGRSERAAGRYRVCDYVADVVAWLEHCELDRVDLYGHSLGALVAMGAAAALPERVRSIMLEDPPSPGFLSRLDSSLYCHNFSTMQRLAGSQDDIAVMAAQLAGVRLGPGPDAVRLGDVRDAASLRFSARCLQMVDSEVFAPLLEGRWLEGFDYDATAATIECPVLLMHGEVRCGGMLPEDDARQLAGRLRRGTVVRFADAGHLLHWQRAEETARYTLSFLESL